MNFNLEPAELAKKITVMPDTKHQQPMQLSTPLLEDPRERGAYETACETLNFLSNYGVRSDVNLNKPDMKEEHFERTMTQKNGFTFTRTHWQSWRSWRESKSGICFWPLQPITGRTTKSWSEYCRTRRCE